MFVARHPVVAKHPEQPVCQFDLAVCRHAVENTAQEVRDMEGQNIRTPDPVGRAGLDRPVVLEQDLDLLLQGRGHEILVEPGTQVSLHCVRLHRLGPVYHTPWNACQAPGRKRAPALTTGKCCDSVLCHDIIFGETMRKCAHQE